jgi:hypothetical protein
VTERPERGCGTSPPESESALRPAEQGSALSSSARTAGTWLRRDSTAGRHSGKRRNRCKELWSAFACGPKRLPAWSLIPNRRCIRSIPTKCIDAVLDSTNWAVLPWEIEDRRTIDVIDNRHRLPSVGSASEGRLDGRLFLLSKRNRGRCGFPLAGVIRFLSHGSKESRGKKRHVNEIERNTSRFSWHRYTHPGCCDSCSPSACSCAVRMSVSRENKKSINMPTSDVKELLEMKIPAGSL